MKVIRKNLIFLQDRNPPWERSLSDCQLPSTNVELPSASTQRKSESLTNLVSNMSFNTKKCYIFLSAISRHPLKLKLSGNEAFRSPRNISEAEPPAPSKTKVTAIYSS